MPEPDYKKTKSQVFCDVAAASIHTEDSLSILSHVYGPQRDADLPTWVPDWEFAWPKTYACPMISTKDAQAAPSKCQELVRIAQESRQLIIRGKLIDRITSCSQTVPVMQKVPLSSLLDVLYEDLEVLETVWEAWAALCAWAQHVRSLRQMHPQILKTFEATILQGTCSEWHPKKIRMTVKSRSWRDGLQPLRRL